MAPGRWEKAFADRLQDVELVLKRAPGGGWAVIYNLSQRWVKNNRDPENIVYITICICDVPADDYSTLKGMNALPVNTNGSCTMIPNIY